MGYLQDFYPLDFDSSYIEYVISALKYDDNDILFLDVHKLVDIAQRFHLPVVKMAEVTQLWKRFKIKIMAYLKDFYPLDIDDSYLEYVISELKYDDNDILFLDVHKLVNTAQFFRLTLVKIAKWPKLRSYESASKLK